MSRRLFLPLLLILSLGLQGCSSLLSATSDGPIQEDYGKRTLGAYFEDQNIETKAEVNLRKSSDALKKSRIRVKSFNGVVLLVGQVSNEPLRRQASEIVSKIQKVRRIHNELSIAGPINPLVKSSDSWLATKIRSRLAFTKQIDSDRVTVIVENGVVYLMGLVTREEASRVVAATQKSHGVQKIVKAFEYIDDRIS
jgi:osmotically-inducible protein OsmY